MRAQEFIHEYRQSVIEIEDTPPEVVKALDQAAQKNGYRNWADVKANPRSPQAVMTVAKLANTILRTTGPRHEKLFYKNKTDVDENFADGNSMSTKDMIAYLRRHHDTNLHQDYLDHLNTFGKFALKNIPTNTLKTELAGLDPAKVERYKQMDFSKAPPIVTGDGNILDGYHRAVAAKELGIPTIRAYVGIKGQQDMAEGFRRKLNFDEIYGKYLKVTDNNGDPGKPGFSLVTPLNGDSWNWRERPEFISVVKKKLNQPGWLGDHKYQQIIDAMSGKQFDPAKHIAKENFADGKIKEMAPPPILVQSSTLYHGTPTLSNAQGIIRNGLKFDTEMVAQKYQGSENFSPLPGVYLSKDFGNAVRYSFMSNVSDEQYADYIKQEPYGYVFEFSGKSLSQTSPDEDELGRLLEKFVKTKNLPPKLSLLIQGIPEDLKTKLSQPNVSFETIAMAGKWLVNKLKPQTLQYLMQRYMNVVNYGEMKPIAVWKIPKPEQRFLRDRQGTFDTLNGYINWANRYAKKQPLDENFADGKVKGKSRPGRVKRAGASCNGSVTDLRARAKRASGEKAKMYHWCANMKSGKKNESEMDEGWKQNVAASVLGAGIALGGGTAQADTDAFNKKSTPAEIQQIQAKADLTQRYYNELVRRAKEDGQTLDTRTLNRLKAKAQDLAQAKIQQQPQTQVKPAGQFPSQGSETRRANDFDKFESVKK